MSPRFSSLLGISLLSALLACEAPPVVPTADVQQNTQASRIEGKVVYQGAERGNVVLFLFDAQDPPPPAGSGSPVSFTLVPESELFGDALDGGSQGPFTAPFIFSLVAPGSYLVEGFLDYDGCLVPFDGCRKPDFNPFYSVTNQPNAGDILGAAADLTTEQPTVLTIAQDSQGDLNAVTDVSVAFSEQIGQEPTDRPVFSAASVFPGGDLTVPLDGGVLTMELTATPIVPTGAGVVDERNAVAFLVQYADDDHDGMPDIVDGVPQFWPKVIVRKAAASDPTNLTDETTVDYPHLGAAADGKPDEVVLAAGIYPTSDLLAALGTPDAPNRDADGGLLIVPFPAVTVVVEPLALDISDPAAPAPLAVLPAGNYAIDLLSFTGQTWRVPNELEPGVGSTLGLPELPSQASVVVVPP